MFESHHWFPTKTRRFAPLVLALCFLSYVASDDRFLQEEVIPDVEFDIGATDTLRLGSHNVVSGWFYVKGAFTLGSLGDVAFATRETLANVCDDNLPTLALARQDILTVSEPEVGLNMTFYVLPPKGWAHHCVAMLRFAGFGPTTPPFTTTPAPPIRQLLQVSVGQNTGINEALVDDWVIDIGNVNCDELMVSYGNREDPEVLLERSRMPDEWRGREEPAPCGSLEAKWVPSSAVKFPWEEEPCKAAASACICASIRTCRYMPVPGGRKRCTNGWETAFDVTSVSCEDCPYQPQCPPTCKDAFTPCTCIFWNCTWDESRSVCDSFDPNAGDLSCLLCSRQAHCVGLEATQVLPAEWSFLDETGWFVNVTFNRPIIFGPLLQSDPRAIHFRCQSEEEAALQPPAFVRFDLALSVMQIVQDRLHINARQVPNDLRLRYCQLVVYEGSILDTYYVSLSTWRSHWFVLGDTVAPTLEGTSPDNSASNVPLDLTVHFVFSESISFGPAASESIVLSRLGGEGLGGPKDVVLATFSDSSPRVQLHGNTLTVQAAGFLTFDAFYSIGIGSGAVRDATGNTFTGLTTGIYAFRTVTKQSQAVLDQPRNMISTAAVFTITCAAVLVCSALTVGVLALWQKRRSRSISPEQPDEIQEADDHAASHDAFRTMKELQNLKSWHGPEHFETLFEELRTLQKEDENALAYQPPLDDSYYATVEPLSAGSSTVLEPDLAIINKARPISASSVREEGQADGIEVYAYYAFPPPIASEIACPPSSGPPALMDYEENLSLPSTARMLQDIDVPTSTPAAELRLGRSRRPMSAHEKSKTVIKSLYDSLQTAKAQRKARPQRPQSAPSQRVQEKLVQANAVSLFREFDRRLPSQSNLQALYFDEESRPKSRPGSAVQRQATFAIADYQFGERPPSSRRPTSAIKMRRWQTEPPKFSELQEPTQSLNFPGDNTQPDDSTQSLAKSVDLSGYNHKLEQNHEPGVNLEELRSLGMVWEKTQNIRWSSEVVQSVSLENQRPSLRPRQSRVSVCIEQESDQQTWEMMLQKAASVPAEKSASPEQPPQDAPGIGMPWTWQSSSIDAVDAKQHKDSLTSREESKSGRWSRKSYIWQFQKEEETEKPTAEVDHNDLAGSLGKRHEALGIRSRQSILRTQSFEPAAGSQTST